MTNVCTVYLLHFSRPVMGRYWHYIGETARPDVGVRVAEHRAGRGARLTRQAVAAGIEITLARVWLDAPPRFERVLKNRGGARRFCPVCKAMGKEKEELIGGSRPLGNLGGQKRAGPSDPTRPGR